MERVSKIAGHVAPDNGCGFKVSPCAAKAQSPDDVVIVSALRTPICKSKKGGLKDTTVETMLAHVFKATLERTKIDPAKVSDVVVGNVLAPSNCSVQARMAMFMAGLPDTVPVMAVNRQCSSGLQAFAITASAIQDGTIEVGLSAGVESMSHSAMTDAAPKQLADDVFDNEDATACMTPMGITSENVAEEYKISRETQDAFAAESHRRAAAAQKAGHFKAEIVPITTIVTDKDGEEKEITIENDDGVRGDTTVESLGKLKAAFKKGGSTTAGNSSQVSDGASAVLAMKRSTAQKLGLPILGRFVSYASVGVPPLVMGIGPAFAIPAALEKAGLSINDIDIYEINEAFASQATYSVNKLGIPAAKVNPKGGAIAFGHPLGCTGNRQIATLLHELKRTNKRYGVVSMCIGTGMGAAGVFESE